MNTDKCECIQEDERLTRRDVLLL
jgi:hypothetical protein